MLAGIILSNYKIYQNMTFIPFINKSHHKLSIFIGRNGAGKSSILEALDTFFNKKEWNLNIASKRRESFICPMFLIPKRDFKSSPLIEHLSEFFWSYQTPTNKGIANYNAWDEFVNFREKIQSDITKSDYYLIVIGINELREINYTSTHQNSLTTSKEKTFKLSEHIKLLASIVHRYAYIYLPIHNSPTELLHLRSNELQGLLDKNLIKEIDSILAKEEDGFSPIKDINIKLEKFMLDINQQLGKINEQYQYKNTSSSKFSANDITDIILNKYISKRPLQKDGKSISDLSSGEQRMAIIDVAYALLSNSALAQKELILAIDEPEASLSPTNCLGQFRKIFNISKEFKKQVLISTHWYGLLMTPEEATLNHVSRLEEKPAINSLDLSRIQDERKRFPDAFEMKSYFDLVSSILSVMKGGREENWIICEGHNDQNYLRTILKNKILNLTILPVGGRSSVQKIYEYLRIAAEDSTEQGLFKGKVLCLIDTDTQIAKIQDTTTNAQKILKILRFQVNAEKNKAYLVPAASFEHYHHTELEDTLDPKDFFNAAKIVARRQAPDDIKAAFNSLLPNTEVKYSGINHDLSFLSFNNENFHLKNDIKNFLQSAAVKAEISRKYTVFNTTPEWSETIEKFFRID